MKFKRVYLEINNTCNLSCSFCAKNDRVNHILTQKEFDHIINQIKKLSDYVYFHVQGEPLMHPLLEDFLARSKELELHVLLVTNGTLLKDKETMLLQSQSLYKISFSLHSMNEHFMEDAAYLNPILAFCDQAISQGFPNVELRFWNCKVNKLDLRSSHLLDKICDHFSCPLSLTEMISQKNITLAKHIYLHFDEPFIWPDLSQCDKSLHGTCYGARDMFAILSDGQIVPCCLDYNANLSFGNIFDAPLDTILSSTRFKALQHGFLSHQIKEPLCKKCSYRLRFDRK